MITPCLSDADQMGHLTAESARPELMPQKMYSSYPRDYQPQSYFGEDPSSFSIDEHLFYSTGEQVTDGARDNQFPSNSGGHQPLSSDSRNKEPVMNQTLSNPRDDQPSSYSRDDQQFSASSREDQQPSSTSGEFSANIGDEQQSSANSSSDQLSSSYSKNQLSFNSRGQELLSSSVLDNQLSSYSQEGECTATWPLDDSRSWTPQLEDLLSPVQLTVRCKKAKDGKREIRDSGSLVGTVGEDPTRFSPVPGLEAEPGIRSVRAEVDLHHVKDTVVGSSALAVDIGQSGAEGEDLHVVEVKKGNVSTDHSKDIDASRVVREDAESHVKGEKTSKTSIEKIMVRFVDGKIVCASGEATGSIFDEDSLADKDVAAATLKEEDKDGPEDQVSKDDSPVHLTAR